MSDLVLHLRPEEKAVFDGLADDLKDGWKVEEETLEGAERSEELKMRSLMLKTRSDEVKDALDKAEDGISSELTAEAFFAMGTEALSSLIKTLLAEVKTDDDLKGVAELTQIRKALLESNVSPATA